MHTITIKTPVPSPYQVSLFNALNRDKSLHVQVIYHWSQSIYRQWNHEPIAHEHVMLNDAHESLKIAEQWIANADLAIFSQYRDQHASRWLHQRDQSNKPWCFWGERPGANNYGPAGKLYRRYALRVLHRCNAPIWGIGQWAVQAYRDEFGHHRKYFNIPYYSDLSGLQSLPLSAAKKPTKFLFCGSLIKRKGIELLLNAFIQLHKKYLEVELHILGTGDLEQSLRNKVAKSNAKVFFHHFKEGEDKLRIFENSDILCVPSKYDGWGLVVPEGVAAGLPVIATNRVGAATDIIKPGINGWVTSTSEASLLQTLDSAVSISPEKYASMAYLAREASYKYDISAGVHHIKNAIQKSLENW